MTLLTYTRGKSGEYVLFLFGKFHATVDTWQEAIEEDQKLLMI